MVRSHVPSSVVLGRRSTGSHRTAGLGPPRSAEAMDKSSWRLPPPPLHRCSSVSQWREWPPVEMNGERGMRQRGWPPGRER